jgi:hypothetical protein
VGGIVNSISPQELQQMTPVEIFVKDFIENSLILAFKLALRDEK